MKPWIMDTDDATAASILATYTSEMANTYISYGSNTSGTAGSTSTFFTTNTAYVVPQIYVQPDVMFILKTG